MPGLVYKLPVADRPKSSWTRTVMAFACSIAWFVGIVCVNGSQFVLLPLRVLPFAFTRRLYDAGIRESKGAFGTLLLLMCQWFAPTKMHITFEREGPGSFTDEELDNMLTLDSHGRVSSLNLPKRSVLISNHQVYPDWWYAWCLTYFMGTHKDVLIVLKKSLKYLPILGWGMQFFQFIFLARSWASDRVALVQGLARVANHAKSTSAPLTFILYPEGTLVSKDTRPISKKYADKLGVPDTTHVLLPRSTGLLYSLRALAPRVPGLQLIDITLAYPGIPYAAWGQDYYTLRSVFVAGVPPPTIHVHIRKFDVRSEVPIGVVEHDSNPPVSITAKDGEAKDTQGRPDGEAEVPANEAAAFELWLREVWRQKDKLMERYHVTGTFAPDPDVRAGDIKAGGAVDVPLQTRYSWEVLYAYCFFVPAVIGWAWARVRGFVI